MSSTKTHACLICQNSGSISRKGSQETREKPTIEASHAFLHPNVLGSLGNRSHTVLRHHAILNDVSREPKEPEGGSSESTCQEGMKARCYVPFSQFSIVDLVFNL